MKALQITELSGPRSAMSAADLPDPPAEHPLTPGSGVLIDVHAAGVAFPEVLQTRGLYQIKPDLPFVPGSEVAGVVRTAPAGAAVRPGDRVAAFPGLGGFAEVVAVDPLLVFPLPDAVSFDVGACLPMNYLTAHFVLDTRCGLAEGDRVAACCMTGGFAEVAVAPAFLTFPLPDELDFAQGASLVMNYHTAYFALKLRGRLEEGETVLVHGAAGGVGTATLQVAKGLGARTIAVVSSEDKERVAREAGADETVRSDGPWKDEAKQLSGGGVDVVVDPVGGDRFTDSLRSLREGGRVVVVGFTGGSIPEVKVNRLLLNNVDVRGVGWGAYAMSRPGYMQQQWSELLPMMESGTVKPPIGATYDLADFGRALTEMEDRRTLGKSVVRVRP